MFKPDKLLASGEIQVSLSNSHVVPGKIVMTEDGEVSLTFTDPKMVGQWLRTTLDQNLIGLRIVTLTETPVEGLVPAVPNERPEHVPAGMDYLQERDGDVIWFHTCPLLGSITLPGDTTSCPNCGFVQLTRRPA